jgi:hypothetical protein
VRAPDPRAAALGARGQALHLSQVPQLPVLEFELGHVRVYRGARERCLAFVRDGGVEATQTCVDLKTPHEIRSLYLRRMVECPRYSQTHESVLLVGLGGGSLAHYYQKHYPGVAIDAVEVDPVIVDVAQSLFGVESVNITCADAADFLRAPGKRYDAVYVDAFQPPSGSTSSSGVPLSLRTPEFLECLKRRLTVGGAAAFNCHDGHDDVRDLCRAFHTSYVLPAGGSSVVIGVSRPW